MKVFHYTIDQIKTMTSMGDFYKRVGIIYNDSSGEEVCLAPSVQRIFMNERCCLELQDILKENQKYQKGSIRHYTKKYYEQSVGMDWLCYSPTTKKEIPDYEIWIDV